ncbi:MAG: glutamate racemase [Peptostreptococcaceae bacterium]|nr:glutamate racemase [Peptostreptococcaceae bacterium]MDY5739011.1 glutamate racemase [Anaerovoracaceae bacterium]SFE08240.1 glutamate racemase [Peptostreptococcaceae bacterium pGA-8]
MDNRPIGFFDSGLGGLTSIPHLMKNLPNERIIFFGDTARTPYGSKSPETIRQFTMQIGEFLVKQNVKMIVIACNTISATCLTELREKYPHIPVVGVISPTARVVANSCSEEDKVGIIATKVTVESKAYENKIREKNPNINTASKACPAFVPLIEEGIIDNEIMDLTIKYYLDDFIEKEKINTLVLGCTHYPLIGENLGKLYPDIKIINSSKEVVDAIKIELDKRDGFAEENDLENRFFASDLSENFVMMIKKILGKEEVSLNIHFKNLDI